MSISIGLWRVGFSVLSAVSPIARLLKGARCHGEMVYGVSLH
ncbi:hypothetical protein ACTXNE_08755 [Psychrobacter namhaensis]